MTTLIDQCVVLHASRESIGRVERALLQDNVDDVSEKGLEYLEYVSYGDRWLLHVFCEIKRTARGVRNRPMAQRG